MWEYIDYDGWSTDPFDTLQVRVVSDSTDPFGMHHIVMRERVIDDPPSPSNPVYRHYALDSSGQVFLKGSGTADTVWRLEYKLNAGVNDWWIVRDFTGYYHVARVKRIYERNVFGVLATTKETWYYGTSDTSDTTLWQWLEGRDLSNGFGKVFRGGGETTFLYLRGAYINGVLYGDTTVVSVEERSTFEFSQLPQLFQNYPNPFNASTIIRYELPKREFVSLKVYNILGQEVAQLVNQSQEPGLYQMAFEAKDLASGVYFNRLRVAEKTLTRLMVLLR